MLVSNSDLVDQLQRKRLDFEDSINAKNILHREKQGQLDSLVEGLAHSNRKITGLRNSVRAACKRWENECLSQQQDFWKLQQAAVVLQRSAVCKPIQSLPRHAQTQPLAVQSFQTPRRSVFSEVQLNGQGTGRQEHDPKVDRQVLHTQLRSMITTSTGTLRTLSRLGQTVAECQPHSAQYEQSGLYIMIDPETGKPIGGQLVQPEQIHKPDSEPHNEQNQPPQSWDEPRPQHENQPTPPQAESHVLDPSAGHSTSHEPGNEFPDSPDSVHEHVEPASRCSVGPIELLTPAIDHAQNARCEWDCSVHAMPDLGRTAVTSNSSSPVAHGGDLGAEPNQHGASADEDEQGIAQAAEEHNIPNKHSSAGFHTSDKPHSAQSFFDMVEDYEGTVEQEKPPGKQERSVSDEGMSPPQAEEVLPSHRYRVEQSAKDADWGTQTSSSQVTAEESHGNVHMQPSGTSLSSLEVPEPIVGPIGMEDHKCATREPSEQWAPKQSTGTTGTSFMQAMDVPPGGAKINLQFSDNEAAGTQLGSSAVLELLKEESDLIEDDDGPLSFMTQRWSSRKGTRREELSKSPDMSSFETATKPAPVLEASDFDF